jgi:hypothetical protein
MTEPAPQKPVNGPPTPRLVASLDDAETLMQHAARGGLPIAPEAIKTIVEARAAVAARSVSADLETRFWTVLAELSKAMQPATIEGIKETRYYNGGPLASWLRRGCCARIWRWMTRKDQVEDVKDKVAATEQPPEAYVAVWRYTIVALLLLAFIVIVQGITGYGATILENLRVLQEQRGTLDGQSDVVNNLPMTDPTKGVQLKKIDERQRDIVKQEEANISLLRVFNSLSTPWFALLPETIKPKDDSITVAERASFSVAALNGYLMPVLIGTLGAVAHILRSLARQISEDSYSSEARVQMLLRLVLGPLAGAAVGLIFVEAPDAAANEASNAFVEFGLGIGPFALPFIAGYSVEFFFELADRVIGAFTSKP